MRSAQDIWEAALGELQLQVNKPNYQTWFSGSKGLTYQGDRFVIGVSNSFVAEYLEKNQRSLIEKTLIGLTGKNVNVSFSVASTSPVSPENRPVQVNTPLAENLGLALINTCKWSGIISIDFITKPFNSKFIVVSQNPRECIFFLQLDY